MIDEITLATSAVLFAFLLSLILTNWWINVAKKNKLLGKDMNKHSRPLIAEAGGIAVVSSIIFSLLFYIFLKTFMLKTELNVLNIAILAITLLLACFIGFIDDILGWKKGLKQWQKLILTLPIAIPLIVINAGHSTMSLPFIGAVNFGLLYPLLLIPIAVLGTTNGYNILAGYNGLEASLGVVIFGAFGIISMLTGQMWLALVAGIIIFALLGFLFFNKYPSRIFPGDSLTYSLGALVACFAVLGNMEKFALVIFIPFIIEGILKARSRLKAENFGIPNKDDSLEAPYKQTYSLTHFALKMLKKVKPSHKVYEKDVVILLVLLELLFALSAFAGLL
jgi:UDP-N-acetylglucosamine--dolichyl-phosphate N-acetylglucosaminephosphotransferase